MDESKELIEVANRQARWLEDHAPRTLLNTRRIAVIWNMLAAFMEEEREVEVSDVWPQSHHHEATSLRRIPVGADTLDPAPVHPADEALAAVQRPAARRRVQVHDRKRNIWRDYDSVTAAAKDQRISAAAIDWRIKQAAEGKPQWAGYRYLD